MGFKRVYEFLREAFPQVDPRILRAVAIEHAKDVNAAVNDVLTEVIPFISENTTVRSQDPCLEYLFKGKEHVGEDKMKMDSLRCKEMATEAVMGLVESGTVVGEASNGIAQESGLLHSHTTEPKQSVSSENDASNDVCEQSHENTETTCCNSPAKMQEDNGEVGLGHEAPAKLNDLVHDDGGDHEQSHKTTKHLYHISSGGSEDFNQDVFIKSRLIHENGAKGSLESFHHQFKNDFKAIEYLKSSESHFSSSFPKSVNYGGPIDIPSLENCSLTLPKIQPYSESDVQKSNSSPKQDCSAVELSDIADGLMGHAIITQSGQLCKVDLLDGMIKDAKSNKITLFSAMESVINKMRELEHKESAVEIAKEAAASGEWEILAKVDELKQIVMQTKERNDVHAGEVYGEKAILATEARELQSRLLSLSDERDKSLSILAEMQKTIEARLAAVDAILIEAREVKLEKEQFARNSLAEQEALLKKVSQESVILQRDAEENTRLQEFLMDRGRVVDTLQGEISVICQDVMQLKEKFDEQVPLSKSLSSSQTSCILASSGSSLKGMASDLVRYCSSLKDVPTTFSAEQGVSSNTPKKGSPASSAHGLSPKSNGEERGKNFYRAFSDDEWDVFDQETEFAEAPYTVGRRVGR